MQENDMMICPTENEKIWLSQIASFPIYLPLFCAVYLTGLNELRLFQIGENTARQQSLILEIFSNQSDGVVLLSKPQNSDEVAPVLYSNKTFESVTRNQHG